MSDQLTLATAGLLGLGGLAFALGRVEERDEQDSGMVEVPVDG